MKLTQIVPAWVLAAVLSIASVPVHAKLAAGAAAPDFSAPAALAGKTRKNSVLKQKRAKQDAAKFAAGPSRPAGAKTGETP